MGVGGQRHAPDTLPSGKTRCPSYRRLGGSQHRYGLVRKISHAPGFDPGPSDLQMPSCIFLGSSVSIVTACKPTDQARGYLQVTSHNRSTVNKRHGFNY